MEIKMIQTINSTMKIQFRHTRVFTFLLTLLLLAGVATPAWAATVTYHVLTLPMSSTVYNINSEYNGKRLEAIQVKVDNATSIELPVQNLSTRKTSIIKRLLRMMILVQKLFLLKNYMKSSRRY